MSTSSIRTAGLAAALMGMAGGFGQSAAVIERPYYNTGPIPTPWRGSRSGNNRPAGPTRAQKKRKAKIARASRRYNLRTGA